MTNFRLFLAALSVNAVCAFSLAGICCVSTTHAPTKPDAAPVAAIDASTPADDATKACDNLAKLNCPEGAVLDCGRAFREALSFRLAMPEEVACVGKAASKEAVRACGAFVPCTDAGSTAPGAHRERVP